MMLFKKDRKTSTDPPTYYIDTSHKSNTCGRHQLNETSQKQVTRQYTTIAMILMSVGGMALI